MAHENKTTIKAAHSKTFIKEGAENFLVMIILPDTGENLLLKKQKPSVCSVLLVRHTEGLFSFASKYIVELNIQSPSIHSLNVIF